MVLPLAACSKQNSEHESTSPVENKTDKQTEAKGMDFSGKELNVLLSAATFSESLQSEIPEFESKYGVKVNYEVLGRNNYDDKMMIELSSGSDAHDVYYNFDDNFLQVAENGWIQPLDEFIADKNLTDEAIFSTADYLEGPFKAGNVNGKQYGIPVFSGTCLMYYRKDYFEKAGIAEPPKTWEELEEACKKLKAIGVAGIAMRGAKGMGGNLWHFPMLLYSYGGSFYKDFPNDMHPTIDTPEFIETAKFYSNLLNNYGIKGAVTCNYEDIILAVQQGDVGIWIDGAPLVAQYEDPEKSKSSGKIGYSVIPAGPKGVTAAQTNHFLVMNVNSKEKELAWVFIQWSNSKDVLLKLSTEKTHVAVTRKSVLSDPAYIERNNYGNGDWAKCFSESLAKAKANYYPLTKEWPEVTDIVSTALSEVFVGKKTAEDALNEANKRVDDLMQQAGYY